MWPFRPCQRGGWERARARPGERGRGERGVIQGAYVEEGLEGVCEHADRGGPAQQRGERALERERERERERG